MGSAVMSTSASSLNWWYIEGSRRLITSAGIRVETSRKTPPCGEPRPGLHLGVDRAGHLVAGQQLGRAPVVLRVLVPAVGLVLGLGVLLLEDVRHVVEHEPLALGVAQHPAVTAHRLGDQDALHRGRPDHPGRVELHELHVEQRGSGEQRQRVTVAGVLPGVRGDLEGLADAAGGQHHGRRLEDEEPAGLALRSRRRRRLAPPVLEQLGDRALLEHLQPGLVSRRLLARPPAAARRSSAAGCGSAPGRCGRRRAPAAGTRGRRSCAG